jgi:two-component system, NarL family, response regulator NreC
MPGHLHLVDSPTGSETPLVRVVVAVRHALMRRGLQTLLENEAGIKVVAASNDPGFVADQIAQQHPDVLVIDLRMEGGSSVDSIRHFRELAPDVAIVALTMEDSVMFAERAFEAGATAYVLKDRADVDLVDAIRRAAQGERYESPRPAPSLGAR